MNANFKNAYFWLSILLLAITDVLLVATYLRWLDFGFVAGPYRFNHWLGWLGFLFVLVHVPLFVTLKRRYTKRIRLLLGIHVLGNLTAYMLITIHFAHQISRPSQFYPDLGTGIALYAVMIVLVSTGFLQRFNLLSKHRKSWRFLHASMALSLFTIIFVHILHGLQII